jgi:hypothetical protein
MRETPDAPLVQAHDDKAPPKIEIISGTLMLTGLNT